MTFWVFNDGGRAAAGYRGRAGDCVVRSIAIASGRPYKEVYDALSHGARTQRPTKYSKVKPSSARDGVETSRRWFKDYMASIGFCWVPTMKIGSGCRVHLDAAELPSGRLVVVVSNHYTAVIDGVIHDTFDPRREVYCTEPYREPMPAGYWTNDHVTMDHIKRRCVYGIWTLEDTSGYQRTPADTKT